MEKYVAVNAAAVAQTLNTMPLSSKGTKFLVTDPPVEVVAKRQRFPAVPCAHCLRAHGKLIVRSVTGEQRDRLRFLRELVACCGGIYLHAVDEQSTALLAKAVGAKAQRGNPDNYDYCATVPADYSKKR